MRKELAMVFCVHHKPWLMMSTLITALAQDYENADLYIIYNEDSAQSLGASDTNLQLSPFDERVREVCGLNRPNVFVLKYQNDEALDSGSWYKFIRSRLWMDYEWVLFGGEGTLFARPTVLSAVLAFAESEPDVHVIASGHEKRRLPKSLFFKYNARTDSATEIVRLHDDMIQKAFAIFSRDPAFRRVLDAWTSDFPPETQNHVPAAGPPSPLVRRLQAAWIRRFGPPHEGGRWRQLPWSIEYLCARARMLLPYQSLSQNGRAAQVHVNGRLRAAETIATVRRVGAVGFHRANGVEWFACTGPHLMSRQFLTRLSEKLDEFQMYDVLNLRFSGSALEVIWGFIPEWLGFDKWFTDGFHRIRKDFATYRREDYPPEMATYINRYYRGALAVAWSGDYLKVRALTPGLERLRDQLPAVFF